MPPQEDNISVNEEEGWVVIRVNPRIYKPHVILRAADELIDDAHVVVDGDPEREMWVKLIPREAGTKRKQLLNLAYKFNTLLVSCSVKG